MRPVRVRSRGSEILCHRARVVPGNGHFQSRRLGLVGPFGLNLFANCHVSFTPLLTQNKPALLDEWQAIIGYLAAYLRNCLHDIVEAKRARPVSRVKVQKHDEIRSKPVPQPLVLRELQLIPR